MTWIYRYLEPSLWTVGVYTPTGAWEPESDCGDPDEAAARVAWLNEDDENNPVRATLHVELDGRSYEEEYLISRRDWEDMTPEQRSEDLAEAAQTMQNNIAPCGFEVHGADAADAAL